MKPDTDAGEPAQARRQPSADAAPDGSIAPVVLSRLFQAPREQVFRAWGSADQLKRWFCPDGFSVPQAQVKFRVGGAFDICMRSARGQERWTRGRYTLIEPHDRLAIEMSVMGEADVTLFRAHTSVTFADEAGGATRMQVTQSYTPLEPAARAMIQGAAQGWEQALAQLERELSRQRQRPVTAQRSAVHASFSVERTYQAAPAEVYRALTDVEAKAQWFGGGSAHTVLERHLDVRPGGREVLRGRAQNGVESRFEAVYHDVVPEERLVYSYVMDYGARRLSVSLVTFELKPAGGGTRLVFTEQGAFLDGHDDAGSRRRGAGALLDALGRWLQGQTQPQTQPQTQTPMQPQSQTTLGATGAGAEPPPPG